MQDRLQEGAAPDLLGPHQGAIGGHAPHHLLHGRGPLGQRCEPGRRTAGQAPRGRPGPGSQPPGAELLLPDPDGGGAAPRDRPQIGRLAQAGQQRRQEGEGVAVGEVSGKDGRAQRHSDGPPAAGAVPVKEELPSVGERRGGVVPRGQVADRVAGAVPAQIQRCHRAGPRPLHEDVGGLEILRGEGGAPCGGQQEGRLGADGERGQGRVDWRGHGVVRAPPPFALPPPPVTMAIPSASRQTVAPTLGKSAGPRPIPADGCAARWGGRSASSAVDRIIGVEDMAAMVPASVEGARMSRTPSLPPPPAALSTEATALAQSIAAPAPTPRTLVAPSRVAISAPAPTSSQVGYAPVTEQPTVRRLSSIDAVKVAR